MNKFLAFFNIESRTVPLCFAIYFLIGAFSFSNYNYSWDEQFSRYNGKINYDYITKNDRKLLTDNEKYHGPFFELILYGEELLLGLKETKTIYQHRHFINFLLFFLSAIAFFSITKSWIGNWKWALLGVFFFIIHPKIYSHSFFNSKDVAFLSFFTFAMWSLIRLRSSSDIRNIVLHAVLCGLAMDIRNLGILLLPITGFALVGDQFFQKTYKWWKTTKVLLLWLVFFGLTVVAFWPVMWHNVWFHFLEAFKEMSHYHWEGTMLFMGEEVLSTELPVYYLPVWIGVTTPLAILFLFGVGIVLNGVKLFSEKEYFITGMLLFMWSFGPILAIIILQSVVYDDWRHVYFVYPGIALLATLGAKSLVENCRGNGNWRNNLSKAIVVLLVLNLGYTTVKMIQYHPYEHLYFNRLAGKSLEQVKQRFELDYWGLSYTEGYQRILKMDSSATIKVIGANLGAKFSLDMLTPEEKARVTYTSNLDEADYFMGNFRTHPESYPYGKLLFTIDIDGTSILEVRKLK